MSPNRRGFRIAVAASAAFHLLIAGLTVALCESSPQSPSPRVDTRVDAPTRIAWQTVDAEVTVPLPRTKLSSVTPAIESSPTHSPPEVTPSPRTHPREVLALIHRGTGFQRETGFQPVIARASAETITTMAETTAAPTNDRLEACPTGKPRALEGGTSLHGRLASGQSIVYVLDVSGSMGQGGKLERAKRTLMATLREQPAEVRIQVIAYAGFARVLLGSGGAEATPENVERIAALLEPIEPAGRSAHADALRLAGTLHSDFVLVFTDADDLPAAAVRDLTLRGPVLTVAIVRDDRVEAPRPAVTN